jgi:cytochrome P450 family 4
MKLPGPPALPLVGNSLDFTTKNLCILFQEAREFTRTHVPVARLWLGPLLVVVLSDPNHIGKVVQHDKVGSRGYLIMKFFEPAFRNGLLSTDGDKWRAHRKIVSSALENICREFREKTATF